MWGSRWGSRRWLVVRAALIGATVVAAQAGITPQTARAAGPSIRITDPAPGSTVLSGARFRLGWTESAPASAPIVGRRIVEYAASLPHDGYCANRRYSQAWNNTSANPPSAFSLGGFGAYTCYYWIVTVTQADGLVASARSGYVLGLPAADPEVSITSPAPGALTNARPATYTLTWTESASAGVARRIVTEQSARLPVGRSCLGVTWSTTRTFSPTAPTLVLSGLADGTCYRYTVAVWDPQGGVASATSGPLLITAAPPSCAYGDVLTTYPAYADWSRTLVDTTERVSATYVPPDLRLTTGISHVNGGVRLRALAWADLKALADAARAAATPIDVTSGFRSYASQQAIEEYFARVLGPADGLLRAARPGHSEHQLGTAIDVKAYRGKAPQEYADWTVTPAGAWMRDNAWKYGWLMSYPKPASPAITCYEYEPWHYRYVGRAVAEAVHDSGLTLREYLWLQGSIAPGA